MAADVPWLTYGVTENAQAKGWPGLYWVDGREVFVRLMSSSNMGNLDLSWMGDNLPTHSVSTHTTRDLLARSRSKGT